MTYLDIRTMLFFLAICNLILAVLMASHAPASKTQDVIIRWSIARTLQGIAQLLMWQRDFFPEVIGIALASTFLVTGVCLEMHATARYWGEFRYDRPFLLVALSSALVIVVAWSSGLPAGWRIGAVCVGGFATIIPVALIYARKWRNATLLHRVVTLSYGGLIFAIAARILLAMIYPEGTLMTGGLTQLLTFLPLTMFTILNGFGFIIAMHQKTEVTLEKSEATLERAQTIAQITSWSVNLGNNMLITHRYGSDSHPRPLQQVFSRMHPEDQALVEYAWSRALDGKATYDIIHRVIRRNRRRWLHSRAQIEFDHLGQPFRATGVSRDVTDLREVQEALETYQRHLEKMVAARSSELREAEAQTRLILESTAEGMLGLDTSGNIIFANRAACFMLGVDVSDLIGCNAHGTFHYRHRDGQACSASTCILTESLRTGAPCKHDDEYFWHADGHSFPVAITSQPMLRESEIVGAVLSFTDTSEQVQMRLAREKALTAAQDLAKARSEFIANMSHEIRTPLNAVLGLAQLGARNSRDAHARETFVRIVDSGKHLLDVVNDILDFSKIEAGKLNLDKTTINLGQLLDRVIDLTAAQAFAKGLEFNIDEAVDLPTSFRGDAMRLIQVLVNLLGNAIKFTHSGGISLTVRCEFSELCLQVRDSGIGMTEEQLGRLFHAFEQADGTTTRRFGGTGLGLVISRHLVQLMGGRITVHSRLGKGSLFEVRIPLLDAETQPVASLSGTLQLAGLAATESRLLADKLTAQGATVYSVKIEQSLNEIVSAIILPIESIADHEIEKRIEHAMARGTTVMLSIPAGNTYVIPVGARVLDRPLRPRHITAAMLGHGAIHAKENSPLRRLSGIRILAAEDNAVNRLVLEEMLISEGAELTCVENGKLALDLIQQNGEKAFDIVLTDIQMPEMDGYEAARKILEIAPELPIIGLTAHAMPEEKARCLAAGMQAHLSKPIDLDELTLSILAQLPLKVIQQNIAVTINQHDDEPDQSPAIFDPDRLAARFIAHPGLAERLINSLLHTAQEYPQHLRILADSSGFDEIAFIAHKLRGTSSQLAAGKVEALATATETAARANNPECRQLAHDLADALLQLFAILEVHLHESSSMSIN